MSLASELREAWRRLHRRLVERVDSEHEQIVIRIVITAVMFLYIVSADHGGENAARIIRDSALIYGFAATASLALLAHLLARPRRSPGRRLCGIVTDAIGVNGAMLAGGEAAMLFFPLLLWSILGHGFRYGRLYLAISAVLSTALFIVVIVLSPAWRGLAVLDIGLVLSLVLLPAYFAVLLGKLEGAVHRAEDASRAKSRFLATMSHEFRTPLNAVIGMTDLLRTTPLDAEQQDMVATTRSAAHSLLALVNDVLDIAKIEAGRFVIDEEPFDLHRQLRALRRMLFREAQAKGLYLRLRIDPHIPPGLIGGRGPLHQILVNLTANAIKFTSEGGVLLDVRLLGGEPERPRLRFEVHDTGIGIAAEAQDRIFQSFGQAEGDTARRFGGTGLGLSIARELTELMQGRIGVVSAPGQGSSFWVEMAMRRDPAAGEAGAKGGEPGPGALVVAIGDDAAIDRAMTRLESLAITALAEPDIQSALDQAVSSGARTAMLVVDADPPIDVEALAEALDLRHPNEPVDILTLLEQRHQHLAASLADLAVGDGETVLARALRAALVDDGQPQPSSGSESLRARASANVLLVEDNRTNQHVIGKILEHAGHRVSFADSGEECVELMEAGAFDIVLLDLNMPGMSGFDTLKMLRFMLPIADLPPIVALTADATAETREEAMTLGFSAYLTKPIDTGRMLATIDRLGGRPRQRIEPPTPTDAPPPTVIPIAAAGERAALARAAGRSPVDVAPELFPQPAPKVESGVLDRRKVETLLELDAGDGFFAQVVDDYLLDVTQLEKELHEAVGRGDARAFRDAAHALKSSSAHIGAQAVFEFCVGLRHLDDHALLMRANGDLALLREEIERAREALLQCKERAREAPSARRGSG